MSCGVEAEGLEEKLPCIAADVLTTTKEGKSTDDQMIKY